jgi:hypothetical protein
MCAPRELCLAIVALLLSHPALHAQVRRDMTTETTSRRIALVIGNEAYSVSPLKNPANDARLMVSVLSG